MELKGKLIAIEGLEGAGKTTIIESLKAKLGNNKHILFTREPGGTETSEQIRQILLNKKLDPITKLFLFEAARREHFVNVIFPALKEGKIVIIDRFTDSTIAYQSFLENIGMNYVIQANNLATSYTNLQLLNVDSVKPDYTIFLDIEFKEAQKRLRKRANNNLLDRLNMDEFYAIRRGYLRGFESHDPSHVKIYDVTKKEEGEVFKEVLDGFIWILKDIKKNTKAYNKEEEEELKLMEDMISTQLREFEDDF